MKKIYYHPTFVQYKKSLINLFFSLLYEKNKIREKKRGKKSVGLAERQIQYRWVWLQARPSTKHFGSDEYFL
jgi:hypothetical protein